MRVGYFVKELGQTLKDTTYFKSVPFVTDEEDLVNDACEYAWDHNDGWEWLNEGTIIITLVVEGKELGDFPISTEYDPRFVVGKKR